MRRPKIQISEKTRTVLLLILLVIAASFIIWTKHLYSTNFTDQF